MALSKSQINLNDKISFMTYGSVLPHVGSGIVTGKYTYSGVKKPEEVLANHTNIYPTLPNAVKANSNIDVTKLTYISLNVNGVEKEYALDWIVDTSIVKLNNLNATILIENIDPSKLELLKVLLVNEGFNPIITTG